MTHDVPWRTLLADLLGVFLSVGCAGCGVAARELCRACRGLLSPEVVTRVLPDGTPVASSLDYDGIPRRLVLALKEHGRTSLACELAPALAVSVEAMLAAIPGSGEVALCPIPSAPASRRRRGFDPVRLVLRAARLGDVPLLQAVRGRDPQKSLGIDDRARNLAGAFAPAARVAGYRVLLVDDVVTTGSTLREAARVLRAHGAEVVGAAVVAATPRRFGRLIDVRSDSPASYP